MTNGELKSKLQNSLDYLQAELSKVRTGRASPTLLEEISVDVYDSQMSLKELGSINVPDPQSLVISVWDKSLLKAIAKAINSSDLDLNAIVDGDVIRVPIPDLTKERRQEMTKRVTNKVEDVRASIRNVRQEAMKDIDKEFEDKAISEDEKFDAKEEVENTVKEVTDKAVKLGETKKKDVLSI